MIQQLATIPCMQKQLATTTKGMHTSQVKPILNSKVAEFGEFLLKDMN